MQKGILLTFINLGIVSLLVGCAGLSTKSSSIHEERVALIDQRMQEIEQGLSNLNNFAQNLGKTC